jgi:hypothetical protein
MDNQRYKELDDICNEMEKLMTRTVGEILERHCDLKVYYFFSHDEFSFEVDVPYYNATLSTGCVIPAMLFRNKTNDELREICIDYAGTLATALEDSIRRYGDEKGKA